MKVICHLERRTVLTSQQCILQDSLLAVFLFLLIMVHHHHSHMPSLRVVQYMVLLEQFLKYRSLEAVVSVLVVAVLPLLAVIYRTSKLHSNL